MPRRVIDSVRLRTVIADANDGIIATAGIVEGLLGAGVGTGPILVAGTAAMISGGISVGAAKYAEASAERDARDELIELERRRLERSPAEELAELAAYYEAKGLTADLAAAVADELTRVDAVAAHAEADYGILVGTPTIRPWQAALTSASAFAAGAAIVVTTSLLAPPRWRVPSTLVAVVVSLCLTSIVVGRWGQVPFIRTLGRTVAIGLVAMLATLAVGSLLPI